jgi:rhamnosyl/mannosyltransferase
VVGGIENHVQQLAQGLQGRGHAVEVVTTAPGAEAGAEEVGGVQVRRHRAVRARASTPLSPGLAIDLLRRRLARTDRPDVIHLHAPYPPAELVWLAGAWGRSRPVAVVTHHSDIVRQRWAGAAYRPLQRLVLRRADGVVATTDAYRRTSRVLQAVDEVHVLALGVDPDRFTPPAVDAAGPRRLLFVGRLRHYKGLDHLLRALAGAPEGPGLDVAGTGPEEAGLRALAEELGLSGRVGFLGDVTDEELPGRYRDALALVLPADNRAEAFGTVQLEAMASGTPVISTRLGTGVDEVNLDGVTGLTVPVADTAALATAVGRIAGDQDLRRRLGEGGRRRVLDRYSRELMVDRHEALYTELLDRRRSHG